MLPALWRNASALLIAASLFWAINPLVGRAVRDLIDPVSLSFWRWTVAFMLVLAVGHKAIRQDLGEIWRSWRILLLLGLLGIGLFSTLVYWALRHTTATNNLMMQSASAPLLIVISAALFRERATKAQLAAAGLSVLGLIIFVSQGSLASILTFRFNRGDAASLLAVLLYAFYSALLRKRPAIHPLSLLASLFAVGIITLLPAYAYGLTSTTVPENVGMVTAAAILYVAVFPSFLSFLFFNRAVELIGPIRAGPYLNLPPVFGTGLAILLLGERIALYHLIGGAMIAAGIWCTHYSRNRLIS
jgi:drug/metabolite transporter (DMT)-like permease